MPTVSAQVESRSRKVSVFGESVTAFTRSAWMRRETNVARHAGPKSLLGPLGFTESQKSRNSSFTYPMQIAVGDLKRLL